MAREFVYIILAHVRDSNPALPGYDVPALTRAWRERSGAEAARDELVQQGTPYTALSIAPLPVVDA